jgi:hypothetical protein
MQCGQRAVSYFLRALKFLPKDEAWTIVPHLLQLAAYDDEVVGVGEGATTPLRDCFTLIDSDTLAATARLWLPWTPQLLDLIRRGKGGAALKAVMESNCRKNPQHVCVKVGRALLSRACLLAPILLFSSATTHSDTTRAQRELLTTQVLPPVGNVPLLPSG